MLYCYRGIRWPDGFLDLKTWLGRPARESRARCACHCCLDTSNGRCFNNSRTKRGELRRLAATKKNPLNSSASLSTAARNSGLKKGPALLQRGALTLPIGDFQLGERGNEARVS